MATINLSGKLSDLIGLKKSESPDTIQIQGKTYDWNAHVFTIMRQKYLIFVNKPTLFAFLVQDVYKKDLINLKELFLKGFISQLKADFNITEEILKRIMFNYQEIIIRTTDNDKKVIGSMNDYIYQVKVMTDYQEDYFLKPSSYKSSLLNEVPMGGLKYQYPKEAMAELIAKTGLKTEPKYLRNYI